MESLPELSNEILLAYSLQKELSFFQSGGGVGGIPLPERQHPGREGLS